MPLTPPPPLQTASESPECPTAPESQPRRRYLGTGLVAGVGVAAGLAGWVTAGWYESTRTLPPTPEPTSRDLTAVHALWTLSFQQPGDTVLHMKAFEGQHLLINFWATWCPPCVEEMPLLQQFWDQQRPNAWNVVGLAVDQTAAVERFVQKNGIQFPIGLASATGVNLSKALGNAQGGLPFSVAISAQGQVLGRKIGLLNTQDLAHWSVLANNHYSIRD